MRCTVARPIPVPSKSSARCKPLEHAEQLIFVFHVEADTVVANLNDDRPFLLLWLISMTARSRGRVNLRALAMQILKHLLDQNGIALHRRQFGNLPSHGPALRLRLQQGHDLFNRSNSARWLEA